ncbi:hypothetical protein Trydic_g15629 [Trypoxylus dichotomus]
MHFAYSPVSNHVFTVLKSGRVCYTHFKGTHLSGIKLHPGVISKVRLPEPIMVQDEWLLNNSDVPTQNVTAGLEPQYKVWVPSYTTSDISKDETPRKSLTKKHPLADLAQDNDCLDMFE